MSAPPPMRYCTRCVYPAAAATPLTFDEDGVCSGCRVATRRRGSTGTSAPRCCASSSRSTAPRRSNYDFLIPVTGGKDSYFQTHVVTEVLGLKPLLVTYHGNNYLPEGCATSIACARSSTATTSSFAQRRR